MKKFTTNQSQELSEAVALLIIAAVFGGLFFASMGIPCWIPAAMCLLIYLICR